MLVEVKVGLIAEKAARSFVYQVKSGLEVCGQQNKNAPMEVLEGWKLFEKSIPRAASCFWAHERICGRFRRGCSDVWGYASKDLEPNIGGKLFGYIFTVSTFEFALDTMLESLQKISVLRWEMNFLSDWFSISFLTKKNSSKVEHQWIIEWKL